MFYFQKFMWSLAMLVIAAGWLLPDWQRRRR
jgi:hypothetical protein